MFKSFSSLTEAAAAAAVSHNPLKPGTKSRRANKVSVHTQNSGSSSSRHSQYRPTTLLGAAWRSSLCLPLLLRLAGRQTLAVFRPEILGIMKVQIMEKNEVK